METPEPAYVLLVRMAVRLLPSHHHLPLDPLTAHAQLTPTETAAHAQLVQMAAIRAVLLMFKHPVGVDVLQATTQLMAQLERRVLHAQSTRTKSVPATEM